MNSAAAAAALSLSPLTRTATGRDTRPFYTHVGEGEEIL